MGIILKQGLQNTVISYVGILIGFVNVIVVQPFCLSTEEIGLVRLLFSFSSILAIFIPLGFATVTTKFFPHFKNKENGDNGYFGLLLIFLTIGYTATVLIISIFKSWIQSKYQADSILFNEYFNFVYIQSFFLAFGSLLMAYSFSQYKTTFPIFSNEIVVRIATIIGVVLYFKSFISLNSLITFLAIIYIAQTIILLFYIRLNTKISIKINWQIVREIGLNNIITYALLVTIGAISNLGMKYIDSMMLGSYLNLTAVGIFSIMAFIPTVIEAPLVAIEKIASPKISNAWAENDMRLIADIYHKSSRYMLILGGLFVVGITTNLPLLLSLLPEKFSTGINVAYILSMGAVFNMLTGLNTSIIFNSNNYKIGIVFLIFTLFIGVILNIVLIPNYGMEGAAIATVSASMAYNLFKFIYIKYKYNLQPLNFDTVKIIAIILISFFATYFLPNFLAPVLQMVFNALVTTLTFGILIYASNIIPEFHDKIPFLKKSK